MCFDSAAYVVLATFARGLAAATAEDLKHYLERLESQWKTH